jgi:hypothetical protein
VTAPEWNCGPRCYRDPTIPAAITFAGPPDATRTPELLYPLPGATLPINLGDLTVHWHRGANKVQTAFRLRVSAATGAYEFIVPCVEPPPVPLPPPESDCTYPIPRRAWAALAAENAGGTVTLTIDALDPGAGTLTTSAPLSIAFTPAALAGGVYYFSDPRRGTMRGQLGAGKAQPFISPGSIGNRFACGSCHALTRDGRTIAFAAEQVGYLTVSRAVDPGHPLVAPPQPPRADAATMTFNPDGSRVLVSYGDGSNDGLLVVRDTADGREVARLDPAVLGLPQRKVYFPDWSPDGREIVATVASSAQRPWSVTDGSLVIFPYDDGRFGAARVLVPGDGASFHFYPTFSPDGAWVAFSSAPAPGLSYKNPQSRLRLVARSGGAIHELGNALHEPGKTAGWPRFVPFSQGCRSLYFITFHSKMDYGVLLRNAIDPNPLPQLWLAAIDVRRLPADPSSAPVWLPFQEVRQLNALPTWVEHLVCDPRTSPCGEGSVCRDGECVPTVE